MLREKETVLNKKGEEEEKPLFFGDFETPVTRWLSVAEYRRMEFDVEWKGGEKRGESSQVLRFLIRKKRKNATANR